MRSVSSTRLSAVLLPLACGSPPIDAATDTGAASATATNADDADLPDIGTASAESSGPATTTETSTAVTTGTTDTSTSGQDSTTSGPQCTKTVVLMGYWPPTNEMLRPFSNNPEQNPSGWIGENWHGHGFDVYAFFPEFPPDGDPSNDPLGSPGSVGSPDSDLRVDYQDTSEDFWRIVDEIRPAILITTSRGGSIGWEIEAVEGGHAGPDPDDPALDWSSDGHGAQLRPTEASIEPRSWHGISTYRLGNTLPSQLPMDVVFQATDALGLTSVEIDETGTSGRYLSGFLGLHGLLYNGLVEHNAAAGHIHVGRDLPVAEATQLIEATLEAVLLEHPTETIACPRA